MTILIDLDGVVCTEEPTFERSLATLVPGAREALDAIAEAGHTIVVYSSRSWAELEMTRRWLDDNGVTYHGIHLGKPIADVHLDDRALRFSGDWKHTLTELGVSVPEHGDEDERLLRILRTATKEFLEGIATRPDIMDPVLEVGPMTATGAARGVFARMPETFVDSRALFRTVGLEYIGLDLDATSGADVVCDFLDAADVLEPGSIGTAILLSTLEHMTRVWEAPHVLERILAPGGRAFLLTPWNLRFHGPRPDCWRISDDGYHALFAERFEIEDIGRVETPERPLSPVALTCVIRKPVL